MTKGMNGIGWSRWLLSNRVREVAKVIVGERGYEVEDKS